MESSKEQNATPEQRKEIQRLCLNLSIDELLENQPLTEEGASTLIHDLDRQLQALSPRDLKDLHKLKVREKTAAWDKLMTDLANGRIKP